jgi:hypothetical protein
MRPDACSWQAGYRGSGSSNGERISPDNYVSVWSAGPADVWIVGRRCSPIHWNGQKWTRAALHYSPEFWDDENLARLVFFDFERIGYQPMALHGSGPNDIWAVGCNGASFHWDGTSWSAKGPWLEPNIVAVAGLRSDDLWAIAVGSQHVQLAGAMSQHDHSTVIMHRDRSGWSISKRLLERELRGIAVRRQEVWVVGASGTAFHYDGQEWRAIETGIAANLNSVEVFGKEVWAAGDGGVLLRWDGVRWQPFSAPVAFDLNSLWSDGNILWAVGQSGAILRWSGTVWSRVPSGTARNLHRIRGTSRDDIWAAGDGIILHWDGRDWSITKSDDPDSFRDIFPIRKDGFLVLTQRGKIERCDNDAHCKVSYQGNAHIRSIWQQDQETWALGAQGSVLVHE